MEIGMKDKELLELAAKAAGIEVKWVRNSGAFYYDNPETGHEIFDPLTDDGDALRLAVRLQIAVGKYDEFASACAIGNPVVGGVTVWGHEEKDPYAATRRAIVRAAAEIRKGMN